MTEHWGTFCIGLVIGWFTYFSIRGFDRKKFSGREMAAVISALAGFWVAGDIRAALLGPYGVGLASGFFGYLIICLVLFFVKGQNTLEDLSKDQLLELKD